MIIMQYRFTLPADYDMDIIQKRIRDNGAKLDGFPGLLLKFYLYSRKDDLSLPAKENSYAPLYVWRSADAMTRFLQSQSFVKLTQDFGWP
jgi:heme-degrading monooxygenase HmoA